MFISPQEILSILEHYKYWLIFPIAVFEGPIIIIISGFLTFLGVLNGALTFVILVLADTIGDSLYYSVGRFAGRSNWFKRYSKYLGYSEISEVYLKKHFEKHKLKTFLLAKVSHGVGGTVQVIAGVARFDFKQFIILNLAGTIPKTLILMIIGFYLGNSYVKIDGYLNQMAIVTLSIFAIVIIYLLTNKHIRAHFKKD